MNHLLRVILTMGLSIVALLVILLSTDHSGPYTQMDTFVNASVRSVLGREVAIDQYVEASLPRNYQREMNKVPFDGLRPYSTTQRPVQRQFTSMWGEVMTYTVQNYATSADLVPYPPEDLWCVKLKSADPTVPKVVLLALHQDMYTARWGVHEPDDARAVLWAVGCHFSDW